MAKSGPRARASGALERFGTPGAHILYLEGEYPKLQPDTLAGWVRECADEGSKALALAYGGSPDDVSPGSE